MSDKTILFFLSIIIFILCLVILYQQFVFHKGIQAKIKLINEKLENIIETGSNEKVMIFTANPVLMNLGGQINRLLTDMQKLNANYKREQLSSKKMLSNISHDIKTPLTVILGYLEIMRLSHAEDEMLRKVEDQAKQVMNLINQFFTLAKLESGDMDVSLSKIDITETCRENVLSFYEILLQKKFEVDLSIPETPIYVLGNQDAIQRILSNLLSNAMRYGSDGKYLGIFLRDSEHSAYIDVVDKGKGIEQESIPNVFDRLYTMEDSRNREIQGNGLGLTIAKNLANRLGGDIYVTSTPNIKTIFTVKLKKISYGMPNERNS